MVRVGLYSYFVGRIRKKKKMIKQLGIFVFVSERGY